MPNNISCGRFLAAFLFSSAATARNFLATSRGCKQTELCDAFCEESALSRATGGKSKKLATLALSLRDCGHSCACPFGMERHPPTPYPAPAAPPVPAGMVGSYGWGLPGDPRNGGQILIPAPTAHPGPPPPLPPLPPVPLADFSTVGQRFLPRLAMPKGEVNEFQDLDYEGNVIPVGPNHMLPDGWKSVNQAGKHFWGNEDTGQTSELHPGNPQFAGDPGFGNEYGPCDPGTACSRR